MPKPAHLKRKEKRKDQGPFAKPNFYNTETISSNWRALVKASNSTVNADKNRNISVLDKVLKNTEKTAQESKDWIFDTEEGASFKALPPKKKAKKLEDAAKATSSQNDSEPSAKSDNAKPAAQSSSKRLNAVAIDCEFVGAGDDGSVDLLARCSVVDYEGAVLIDSFVKPKMKVTDYRTHVSGVRKSDLKDALPFETVQKKVADILQGRILVGHSVHHDLKVLFLSHPKRQIRDTTRYPPFRALGRGRSPALRKLAEQFLHRTIQDGEHSSVVDAQTTMDLYKHVATDWEKLIKANKYGGKPKGKSKSKSS